MATPPPPAPPTNSPGSHALHAGAMVPPGMVPTNGPLPSRRDPAGNGWGSTGASPQSDAEFDALADLFIGGESASPGPRLAGTQRDNRADHESRLVDDDRFQDEPAAPASGPSASIELVVMGHLPVRAAPWSNQYCRSLADESGLPVVAVREVYDHVSIDLFQSHEATLVPQGVRTAEDALAFASQSARLVLQTDDSRLTDAASHPCVDRVTVVCGANEAAMIAAYRTFKSLAHSANPARDVPLRFQVAVMGEKRASAQLAVTRLTKAARSFLNTDVELVAVVERVGPSRMQSLYRGARPAGAMSILDLATRPPHNVGSVAGAPAHPAPAPKPALPEPTLPELGSRWEQPVARAGRREAISAGAAQQAGSAASTPPAPPISKPTSQPVGSPVPPAREPVPTASRQASPADTLNERPSLAVLLGLSALPFDCPAASSVELAIDGQGGLHLATLRDGRDPGKDLQALLAAKSWALRHAAMLRLLGVRIPALEGAEAEASADEAVTLHVVTHSALGAEQLLASGVRVHLLTAPRHDWGVVPLT